MEFNEISRIIVSAPVPVPFVWTLDFEFGNCIWDLDFGLGFWTELRLDNIGSSQSVSCIHDKTLNISDHNKLGTFDLTGLHHFLQSVTYKDTMSKNIRAST